MSKATKRKHVVQEILDDFSLLKEGEQIVQVVCSRGNNLHEVMTAGGDQFLVSMPTKFRKNVWIKRGDYVIVESINEGDKVKAEIVSILYKERIKHIKAAGQWPQEFDKKSTKSEYISEDLLPPIDDSGDEDIAPMVINTNRVQPEFQEESDESEDEEEMVEEEEEES